MDNRSFLLVGRSNSQAYILRYLSRCGCKIASAPGPGVKHLILPVPSFEESGMLKGGSKLEYHLGALSPDITVFGGNLQTPILQGYHCIDLLQDPLYLARNASITAHCALKLTLERLPVTLQDCPVLIIGWGRIGKCLAHLLKQLGARVSVYARKPADRAMLLALGYEAPAFDFTMQHYRVIYNTAPEPVLSAEDTRHCCSECLMLDLASVRGIAGDNVISARGLPDLHAPESAGELIGRTVLRLLKEKE